MDGIHRASVTTGPVDVVDVPTRSITGAELPWSARLLDAAPWVTLLTTTGNTPDPIRLSLAPSLAPSYGLHQTTLEVTSGTATYQLPISFAVDAFDVIHIVTDPVHRVSYAVNNGYNSGEVLVVDPYDGTIRKSIRTGRGLSDLAFSPNGADLYAISAIDMLVTRINTESLEVVASWPVPGTPQSGSRWSTQRITAGANGRVFYTDYGTSPTLRLLDTNTGEILDTMDRARLGAASGLSTGFSDIFLKPHEDKLYFTRSPGQTRIGVLDVRDDQLTFLEEFPAPQADAMVIESARIFSDLNDTAFHNSWISYDRSDLSTGEERVPDWISGLSAYGDVLLTQPAIHEARSGVKLADIPVRSQVVDFTPDQDGLIYFDRGEFIYWPLPASIQLPRIGIRPTPADGKAIRIGEDTLSWSALPFVEGYRVYVGTDRSSVNASTPGSPEDRGTVPTNSFQLKPLPASGTFFWRVEALRGDQVIRSDIYSFSVAPFQITPAEIEVLAPREARPQEVVLTVTNASDEPVSWSASSPTSWIQFPTAAGAAGEPLVVELDPSNLDAGLHFGFL